MIWNNPAIVFVCVIRRGIISIIVIETQTFSNLNYSEFTCNDFNDFTVGNSAGQCLVGLSVTVQGGEVFGKLDIWSLDRLLLQLVSCVADILLSWVGMIRTITRPPIALVRDTWVWLLSSLGTHKQPMICLSPRLVFFAQEQSGVVILHIENKSAPLREQKIINLPQNRAVNFQKFPYF